MPEHPDHRPGSPCWVDITADDVDAAADFYGAVVGFDVQPGDPAYGGYRMATVRGLQVAAIGPKYQPGMPTAWTTYLATEDADATVAKARMAGGQVLLAPDDVGAFGRLAILADPTGATFGIWQPGEHRGAQLVGEPGAVAWNQCASTDADAAAVFYKTVFDLDTPEQAVDDVPMRMFVPAGGDAPVGGLSQAPEDTAAHWSVHFAVADPDAAVATATDRGASVLIPPTDFQFGRSAVLRDPEGALFGVVAVRG